MWSNSFFFPSFLFYFCSRLCRIVVLFDSNSCYFGCFSIHRIQPNSSHDGCGRLSSARDGSSKHNIGVFEDPLHPAGAHYARRGTVFAVRRIWLQWQPGRQILHDWNRCFFRLLSSCFLSVDVVTIRTLLHQCVPCSCFCLTFFLQIYNSIQHTVHTAVCGSVRRECCQPTSP